jgi:hypothetical protein
MEDLLGNGIKVRKMAAAHRLSCKYAAEIVIRLPNAWEAVFGVHLQLQTFFVFGRKCCILLPLLDL